jgi:hypothetical protein
VLDFDEFPVAIIIAIFMNLLKFIYEENFEARQDGSWL